MDLLPVVLALLVFAVVFGRYASLYSARDRGESGPLTSDLSFALAGVAVVLALLGVIVVLVLAVEGSI